LWVMRRTGCGIFTVAEIGPCMRSPGCPVSAAQHLIGKRRQGRMLRAREKWPFRNFPIDRWLRIWVYEVFAFFHGAIPGPDSAGDAPNGSEAQCLHGRTRVSVCQARLSGRNGAIPHVP
jgi:hypothetical protein